MSYSRQNFTNGQVLTAEHLNNIEKGIVANENAIAEKQPKGDYATEGFVTDKIAEAQLGGNGTNVDLSAYAKTEDIAKNYQPKGNYLTEHQKIKTINGQSLVGEGDITIEGGGNIGLKLKGKKVMFFGDSITEKAHFYRNDLTELTGIKTVGCFAVSGATFIGGVVSDLHGDPAFGKVGNHLSNQIQKLLNNVSDYEVPDIVIISASINDGTGVVSPTNYDENQFTTEDGSYVDVDTCNLSTFTGAARWAYEKIMSVYPNALVVFCTPLQAGWAHGFESSKSKRDAIVSVCERMSVPYIDAFYDSGVYARYESMSSGKYLRDGVHPNKAGAVVLAKCYARKLEYLLSMEEFSSGGDNTGGNTGGTTTPTKYTFTINPTPSNATVTLNGVAQKSITVDSGTSVTWKVSASGYTEKSGTYVVTNNYTMNVELVANSGSGGGDTGGDTGDTGDVIEITAKVPVTGSIALVSCNGTHNIKKFTPVTNGEEGGEVPWTYVSLASSLYDAADNAHIEGTEIKSGTITKDGDYIEDIVLDATHAVIFDPATGALKIQYSGSPHELFSITTNSALYVTKNPTFYPKMSLGGKYELASE